MHQGVLVSGESHKSRLAILLCFDQRLRRSIWPNEELGVIVENHPVNLPQIKMVRLQTPKRLFEHLQSQTCVSPVRTRFCHQKYFVTASLQASSHRGLPMDWVKHGVKIVHSDELDLNTPQTSGMTRAAAITHARAGASKLWAGTMMVQADAKTGPHHHGELETV